MSDGVRGGVAGRRCEGYVFSPSLSFSLPPPPKTAPPAIYAACVCDAAAVAVVVVVITKYFGKKKTNERRSTAERDHILGISYSPRLYVAHISIWTKHGRNCASIDALQRTVVARLSPELRPKSDADYYYKKHSDHDGWDEAVAPRKKAGK